jgi:hypothetical protein
MWQSHDILVHFLLTLPHYHNHSILHHHEVKAITFFFYALSLDIIFSFWLQSADNVFRNNYIAIGFSVSIYFVLRCQICWPRILFYFQGFFHFLFFTPRIIHTGKVYYRYISRTVPAISNQYYKNCLTDTLKYLIFLLYKSIFYLNIFF